MKSDSYDLCNFNLRQHIFLMFNLILVCMALRHKSWPYYEDWKLVFEKDRTTGLGAEDM